MTSRSKARAPRARPASKKTRKRRGPFLWLYLAVAWGTLLLLAASARWWLALVVGALAVYSIAPIVALIRSQGWKFYPGAAFRVLVVRGLVYVQLLLPITASAGLLGIVAGSFVGAPLPWGRVAALAALTIAAAALFVGYVGSRMLRVRDVDVRIAGLPPAFEGLRIVQISDLHVGPHVPRRFLKRIRATVERAAPDVVAVTGDLVDDRAEDVARYADTLGALPAPSGTFIVAGNHDVYAGWTAVERELRERRLGTVLVNDMALVERDGATLAIVGVGDPAGRARMWSRDDGSDVAPDVARAMSRVPHGATIIALAHNPALWPELARQGASLTLSGHTHWGQFAFPGAGWSVATPFLEYSMGAYVENDTVLYIHPGTGYWGVPFRIGALPEVTRITLRVGERTGISVGPARREW